MFLSERDIESLIDIKEVVSSVEEAFRREGTGDVANFMRTRSAGGGSVLNVMHANLPYLKRGGVKAYLSSAAGTKFALLLFDTRDSTLLAVMGANVLGRYRTGAASAVATKHLYGKKSGTLALFGSGRQALTQVLALDSVMSLAGVRVWSPTPEHRSDFVARLGSLGIAASASTSPRGAVDGAELATTITSSVEPFLTESMVGSLSHVNVCGINVAGRAELSPGAVGAFDTVVIDDVPQAKTEYGDLIRAAEAGSFDWNDAVDLGSIVAGRRKASGRTLFKSGGAALEDVAVASMLYDRALKSGREFPGTDLA